MNKITLLVFMLGICLPTFAQVSTPSTPPSSLTPLSKNISTYQLPSVNTTKLLQEDIDEQKMDKSIPLRFGQDFDVHLSLANTGTWTTLANGDRVWRLKVKSHGAKSLNFIFRKFYMPKGAELFIYNEDKSYTIGAFTSINNKSHGGFSTAPVKGSTVILEYYEPVAVAGKGIIAISSIVHAYRDMFQYAHSASAALTKNYGDSGSCNVDVACSSSAGWEDEITSVALIITSGNTRWCTGSMVNNTANDKTPYFLTANHCLDGNQNNWIFVFNYDSPSCSGPDGSLVESISGSTLRATSATSDFALLELSTNVPDNYNVFFSGWNKANTAPSAAIGIHHPSGDVKKISFENDPLILGSYSTSSHWRVNDWDLGTTEPGSSGSPIYDINHHIVGQLHGGQAACGNNSFDEYGKFAASWTGGGTPATSLQTWLDPSNSGVTTLDGSNFICGALSLQATPTDTSSMLSWVANIDTITNFVIRYRDVNDTTWMLINLSDTILQHNISGLTACTTYEFQIDMDCDSIWSGFSNSFVFKTDGCCEPPTNLAISNITDTTATLSGDSVLAALSYDMRYRAAGTSPWIVITGLTNVSYQFTGLTFCTNYEVEFRTICVNDTTSYGTTFTFSTNCGGCISLPYCTSSGSDVSDEWIENVQIAGISNNSGVATVGYSDFTSISTLLGLGQTYSISLSQGYSGTVYNEVFKVWIDFDQSGVFDNSEEVYNSGLTNTFPNIGTVSVPSTAAIGPTRMRISMQFNAGAGACDNYTWGEVEDYCVNIQTFTGVPCDTPSNVQTLNVTTSLADISWDTVAGAASYDFQYRLLGTTNWTNVTSTTNAMTLTGLVNCKTFEYRVKSNCTSGIVGYYSPIATFMTTCVCNPVTGLDTSTVNSTDATLAWMASANNLYYDVEYKEATASNWTVNNTSSISTQLTGLQAGTLYDVRVKAICLDSSTANYSSTVTFRTDWTVSTSSLPNDIEHLTIYPNPFNENVNMNITLATQQELSIDVIDVSGREISNTIQTLQKGENTISLPLKDLTSGIYFVRLTSENGVTTRRIIKQ